MIGNVFVVLVAAIHAYIVVLEMVLWDKPFGRGVFRTTPVFAAESKVLAANQGLYNGFLCAGLIWSLIPQWGGGEPAKIFFLGCVLIAGLYGGFTVGKRIFVVQALPATLGLLAVIFLP